MNNLNEKVEVLLETESLRVLRWLQPALGVSKGDLELQKKNTLDGTLSEPVRLSKEEAQLLLGKLNK